MIKRNNKANFYTLPIYSDWEFSKIGSCQLNATSTCWHLWSEKVIHVMKIALSSSIIFCHTVKTDAPKDPSRKVEDDTIIFTDVQMGSSAVYQCNISNQHGYLLANAFVNVLCKSRFRKLYWSLWNNLNGGGSSWGLIRFVDGLTQLVLLLDI